MRNVNGIEIPINTPQAKREFYNKANPDESYMDLRVFANTTGKDDFFREKIVPFCKTNNIKNVADVGFGWGKYGVWLNDEVESIEFVNSYDISDVCVKRLNNNLRDNKITNITAQQYDVELGVLPVKHDLVLAIDLIEHFVNIENGWNNLLHSGKYVYTLVPKDWSWHWSEDHLHIIDSNKMIELANMANEVIYNQIVDYDGVNKWFAVLVKGFVE